MATPLTIHHLEEVGSTQHEARVLADTPAALPLLLVADRQTRGRGRGDHTWLTAPRALACSLVVAPRWKTDHWGVIPLIAGLAARKALDVGTGVRPGLKWPNDLVTPGGKVGGILAEAADELVVIGLGVNLFWPDPPQEIAAVLAEDPGPSLASRISAAWADAVLARLGGDPGAWGRDEYRAACVTLGTTVEWEPDGRGEAVDVAGDGGLVVETPRGRVTIRSGEVRGVRSTTLALGTEELAEGNPS